MPAAPLEAMPKPRLTLTVSAECRRALGPGSSKRDDVIGIDGQSAACLDFGDPRQLHDRTASRVQNQSFDVLGVSFDAVALAGHEQYFRRGGRGLRLVLAQAHQVKGFAALGQSCVTALRSRTLATVR